MKRTTRTPASPKRSIRIVDEVVEMVFNRLEEAASGAKKATPRSSSRELPVVDRTLARGGGGLAGAIADLVIAFLAKEAGKAKKAKAGLRKAKKRTSPRGRSKRRPA